MFWYKYLSNRPTHPSRGYHKGEGGGVTLREEQHCVLVQVSQWAAMSFWKGPTGTRSKYVIPCYSCYCLINSVARTLELNTTIMFCFGWYPPNTYDVYVVPVVQANSLLEVVSPKCHFDMSLSHLSKHI